MDRLTTLTKYPLTTFKRCQICGYESKYDDICEFRMWVECDDNDNLEEDNIIVLSKNCNCVKLLENHPRLYMEVPWAGDKPGRFMLICDDCSYRNNGKCSHSDLKENGGTGLEVTYRSSPILARVCFCNGTSAKMGGNNIFDHCKGKVTKANSGGEG